MQELSPSRQSSNDLTRFLALSQLTTLRLTCPRSSPNRLLACVDSLGSLRKVELKDEEFRPGGLEHALVMLSRSLDRPLELWVKSSPPWGGLWEAARRRRDREAHEAASPTFSRCCEREAEGYNQTRLLLNQLLHFRGKTRLLAGLLVIIKPSYVSCAVCSN